MLWVGFPAEDVKLQWLVPAGASLPCREQENLHGHPGPKALVPGDVHIDIKNWHDSTYPLQSWYLWSHLKFLFPFQRHLVWIKQLLSYELVVFQSCVMEWIMVKIAVFFRRETGLQWNLDILCEIWWIMFAHTTSWGIKHNFSATSSLKELPPWQDSQLILMAPWGLMGLCWWKVDCKIQNLHFAHDRNAFLIESWTDTWQSAWPVVAPRHYKADNSS